ncbi:PSP1 domain-containing protein [Taibaiella chishuiensis]|uniref:Cell fate regulator YaaT (PSP1 superfamily) n=1 Tax=Taibaiella chishuiensis TaxID=1434707 RepID=A0A2P8DA62_9BACT|nr:regulatory iron-sulfur-containing complex subunit RicT [Taibaiella chishuiensis]PSK94102.1 cell fate regulator YaaT (PSP1 superfamily) [Taibaiella chishuiensis]
MGCGSCGTKTADGKPSGCQSNGGCSSGGCNRINVFNWLADIPLSDIGKPYPILEIAFNNGSRKDFFRNNTHHIFEKGSWVAVEGTSGFDLGQVTLTGELVKLQMKKYGVNESSELKRVMRPAGERDLEQYNNSKKRERDTLIRARAIAKELNLEMKIAEAEYQADGKKVTFFYTADARVDFRELIKVFASDFQAKVEMRQIGARQESAKVGGIGSCGRELCCSSWLSDFKTVNTTAARYQNLSINQTKLSGQCGRLKCCLNYELDTYMDALSIFPENADSLEMATGRAFLQKKDIFRNLMWYSFGGSSKQYPLTIDRVSEILALNSQGEKPEDLEAVEIQVKHKDPEKTVDMGFVNDVGQLTLSSLSKSARKKAQQAQQQNKQRGGQQQGGKQQQGNKQQQAKKQGAQPQQAQAQQQNNQQPKANKQQNNQQPKQQQGQQNNNQPKQQGNQQPKQAQQNNNNQQQSKERGQQEGKQRQQQQRQPRPQQQSENKGQQQGEQKNQQSREQKLKPEQGQEQKQQEDNNRNRPPRKKNNNRPPQQKDDKGQADTPKEQ